VFLVTLVMLRRVAVAVACIKVASKAVATMPSIMLFPLLPFVLEASGGRLALAGERGAAGLRQPPARC
jgi:hypothetical protein